MSFLKKMSKFFLISLLLLHVSSIYADHSSSLNLSQLIQETLQNNSEIQAAWQHWKAVEATREAESAEEAYIATKLQVITSLKEIYYTFCFVNYSIEILEHNKILLVNLEKMVQTHYAVGKSSQQDVFRTRAEIKRLISRLLMLKQGKKSLLADINRLLNRPTAAPLRVTPILRYTAFHPNIIDLNTRFEKNSPRYLMTLKAVANRDAALESLQNLRQDLLFQIKDNVLRIKRSDELIYLIKDTLTPQAQYTFSSAKASYAVGKVDFLTLLNSLLTLQENELELHNEIAEHEKAIARLENILGETLT